MKQRSSSLFLIALVMVLTSLHWTSLCQAQRTRRGIAYPPKLSDAREEVYKKIGDVELKLYIYQPQDHQATDRRAATVFFFGGGWRSGSPAQFQHHCQDLAKLGMVAATADYRVLSRHGVKAKECVADGKSAVLYLRVNHERLGIDPNRIAAGGGSAGGHVAACTAVIKEFESPGEDTSVSSVPNALVLFNPALVLAPVDGQPPLGEERQKSMAERMGTEPQNLSPWHHVRKDLPPTIIFHGRGDTTVPYRTAQAFEAAMKKSGNQCTLVGYDDQPHGFFNYGRSGNQYYNATMQRTEEFLKQLGYLSN